MVLVAHGIDDSGGMERACAELIRHTHEEILYVVVSSELAPELQGLVEKWIRIRIPLRPIPFKFCLFFIIAGLRLRRLDFDVLHTVGAIVPNKADLATVHLSQADLRATRTKTTSGRTPARRLNTAMARALAAVAELWCYRASRLRALAGVSRALVENLRERYPTLPVVLTPNGVDSSRFSPDAVSRMRVREEIGVAQARLVAIFVGSEWSRKGLAVAMRAVVAARSDGIDIELWVVGEGDEDRMRALLAALDDPCAARFFGRRDDTERFYRGADMFVLPSVYETFSLASFEAASSGLPLVIPRLPGARELVEHGGGGLFTDTTVGSVKEALSTISLDETLRRKLGQEARRRAEQYSWEGSARSVVAVYEQLQAEVS